MYSDALVSAAAFIQMCALDRLLTRADFQGVYYLIHGIHNAAIAWLTVGDVVATFTYFPKLDDFPRNDTAAAIVLALHLYHMVIYWRKLRFDDYLHHGLMIFVALPLGVYYESSTLLGYSLFFTTGLPSILDYFLLFGVRNGWVHPMSEKWVNSCLQLWVRAPGCVSHATFSAAYLLSKRGEAPLIVWALPLLTGWNGLYFMSEVLVDWAQRRGLTTAE